MTAPSLPGGAVRSRRHARRLVHRARRGGESRAAHPRTARAELRADPRVRRRRRRAAAAARVRAHRRPAQRASTRSSRATTRSAARSRRCSRTSRRRSSTRGPRRGDGGLHEQADGVLEEDPRLPRPLALLPRHRRARPRRRAQAGSAASAGHARVGAAARRREALFVGDMPIDVRAARNSGIDVAVVATGSSTREQLAAAEPDHFLERFSDLIEDRAARGRVSVPSYRFVFFDVDSTLVTIEGIDVLARRQSRDRAAHRGGDERRDPARRGVRAAAGDHPPDARGRRGARRSATSRRSSTAPRRRSPRCRTRASTCIS